MEIMKYRYLIEGYAANEQMWVVVGTVEGERGNFPETVQNAVSHSFVKLLNGQAEFMYTDRGCRGPYRVRKFLIEES